MRRSRILKDASFQMAGNYISVAARMIRGVLVARLLGPAGMGLVGVSNLIMNIGQYSDLGLSLAVAREIPVTSGGGDEERAATFVWYGALAKAVGGAILVTGCLVWVAIAGDSMAPALRVGIPLAGVTALLTGIVGALQQTAQAEQRFSRSAQTIIVLAVANLCLGVLAATKWGVTGVYWSQVAAAACTVLYAAIILPPRRRPHIRPEVMARLFRVGFPIMLLAFMGFSLENVDQIMILWLLGTPALGLYTLVLYAGSALSLLPLSLSNVIGPRLLHKFGEAKSLDAIAPLTWKPVTFLSILMPPVIMLGWLVSPVLLAIALPAYLPIVAPLRIYLVGIYFLAVNLGVSATLLALERHRLNVPIMASSIGFNALIDILFVRGLGMGLEGIALGSLCTYMLYWSLHSGLVRWFYVGRVRRSIGMNLAAVWPGFLLVAFLGITATLGTLDRSAPLLDTTLFATSLVVSAARAWVRQPILGPEQV